MYKYIVYLTTNKVNNKIYIGYHKTENPDVFDGYIGNGVNIHNSYTYKFATTPFEYAVRKYGKENFERKILKIFDNRQDALDLERWLVDREFIKRKDTYNIVLGGQAGGINSKIIYQYNLDGEFIREWDSVIDAARNYNCASQSLMNAVAEKTQSIGYLWSYYKNDKIDITKMKLYNPQYIKTYLYDSNGKFVKEFSNGSDCAKFLNVSTSTVCTKSKTNKMINEYYVSRISPGKFVIPNKIDNKKRIVYQYDLEGNYIKEWCNASSVMRYYNHSGLYQAIELQRTWYGYRYSYNKLNKLNVENKHRINFKIGRFDKEGNLLETYDKISDAIKSFPGAWKVVHGQQKSTAGFIFKYLDNNS